MDTKCKEFRGYTTFKNLGGSAVSFDLLKDEIAKMPLYAVLGYLSSLSVQFLEYPEKNKIDFFNPKRQGEYLNLAIVDDFPHELPQAGKMYSPGRVPCTQGRHIFIHSHNIAYLANLAIYLFDKNKIQYELDYELPRRVCRLLLIINDILDDVKSPKKTNALQEKRDFALSWSRQWQFNKYQRWYVPWESLARNYKLYTQILPEYFPKADEHFRDLTDGVDIHRYFLILTHFIAHSYKLEPTNLWLNKKTLLKDIDETKRVYFEKLISKWCIAPSDYKEKINKWQKQRKTNAKEDQLIFDNVVLRSNPLIEISPEKVVCPVIEFLIDKITDEIFFIFSEGLSDKERNDFHNALGAAYEKYANSLLENLSKKDLKGHWHGIPKPLNKKGEELSDYLLERNETCLCFEHKGGRLPTDFLLGGKDEGRVFGPSDTILNKLDENQKLSFFDIKKEDKGLITEGIWQQNIHFEDLKIYLDSGISKIFPILTFIANIRIDTVCYKGYLEPLIFKTKAYHQEKCFMPQWLQVEDVEFLVNLAENNELNLEELFLEKTSEANRSERFDIFLFKKYHGRMLYNKELKTLSMKLMELAEQDFSIKAEFKKGMFI